MTTIPRLPEETTKSAAVFAEYCLMGPSRSLQRVVDLLRQNSGKSAANIRQLEMWSSQFHWQIRVKKYDADMVQARQDDLALALEEMNARHVKLADALKLMSLTQLRTLDKEKKYSSSTALTGIKMSVDMERVARGASLGKTEVELSGGTTTDINDWLSIRTRLMSALRDFPEARLAVIEALTKPNDDE